MDFVNSKGLFESIDRNQKFCIVVFGGSNDAPPLFNFGLEDTAAASENPIPLSYKDILLVNPNTQTCPAFRSTKDAALIAFLYRRVPILSLETSDGENGWNLDMWSMFHMSNDSNLFQDAIEEPAQGHARLRLYEGKMIQQFDHRFSNARPPQKTGGVRGSADHLSADEKASPTQLAESRYSVAANEVRARMKGYRWCIGYREVAGAVANIRSMSAAILPEVGVNHKILLLAVKAEELREFSPCLLSNLNSFIFDYVLRQKMTGTSLSFYIVRQIPTVPLDTYLHSIDIMRGAAQKWITSRVLELTYTAWDLEAFALDCGYDGPPFRWDEERRFLLRCELDAAYFHLYLGSPADWGSEVSGQGSGKTQEREKGSGVSGQGSGNRNSPGPRPQIPGPSLSSSPAPRPLTPGPSSALAEMFPTPRHAVEYIMETFPIVKRKDIKRTTVLDDSGQVTQPGTYITKDTILAIYDAMQTAIDTGTPYQTRLNPPPGPPTDSEGKFIPISQWDPKNWPSHIHPPKKESK